MYGVVRRYQADATTLQDFVQRIQGVKEVVTQIPGFVSYNVVAAGDTVITLSIYQDKAGADASTAAARDYALVRWADLKLAPFEITSGEIAVHWTS